MSENEYGFTCKRFDKETETYHFHFRQYDAETGVWMTPDPIGILGGINLYSYVANNPVNFIDRFGLDIGREGMADGSTQNTSGSLGKDFDGGGPEADTPSGLAEGEDESAISKMGNIAKKALDIMNYIKSPHAFDQAKLQRLLNDCARLAFEEGIAAKTYAEEKAARSHLEGCFLK